MPSVLAVPPYGIAARNAWQPPSGQQLAIDWRHPLTRGLVGCVLLVGQRAFTLADLTAPVPGIVTVFGAPRPLGTGARFTADGQALQKTMPFTSASSFTLDAVVRVPGSTKGGFGSFSSGSDTQGSAFGVGGTTFDDTGTKFILLDMGNAWHATSVNVPTGRFFHSGYTVAAGSPGTVRAYLEGFQVDTWTTFGGTGTQWLVGAETTTTRALINGDVAVARIWNRVLSAPEMRLLAVDPFGMFVLPAPASPLFFLATTANSLSRSTSDAANGTDAVTRALALPRSLTDTAAGGDALARSLSLARATNDTAAGTDTPTRASSKSRSTSDAAAGTDGASRVVQLARTLVDAATGSDVVQRVLRLFRTTTDTGGGTDSATIPGSFRDIEYKLGAVTTKWHATAPATKWRAGPPAT